MHDEIDQALEALRRGEVIVYPTDTVYGLGADALSPAAIEKVYEIKDRLKSKPIHVVVASLEMAKSLVEITPLAQRLAERYLPGALTLVLAAQSDVPELLTAGTGTLGIRIPDNAFCLELARRFGRPFTATSANKSGEANPRTTQEALESLGQYANKVAFVIDGGELPQSRPSTVVDARGEQVVVLREGPILVEQK